MNFQGIVKIIVKTNSNETKVIGYDEARKAWKVNLKAQPIEGEANKEIIKFFTKLSKKKVKIKSGLKSKEKLLLFE